jgi:hypothetical protein
MTDSLTPYEEIESDGKPIATAPGVAGSLR